MNAGPFEEILKSLNLVQMEAVSWKAEPLLIVAGAGSGKTRILVHRIAYLIASGIPSYHILGVTFTNKAAQEMNRRVEALTQRSLWISTFHSLCLRILRMDGAAIGLDKNFTVYDEQDALVLIKESIKELNLNDKQYHPKAAVEKIMRSKDLLITPEMLKNESYDVYDAKIAEVYDLYQKKVTRLNACDFGDLIMRTVQLFEQAPHVLRTWQDRFQHVLVDEYQDTNHAQYRLIRMLAEPRRQITVVGDPDQSIYSWRGADIKNILSFEEDYPACHMIKLEQNYRSTGNILDAANELINHNTMRKPKALWTDSEAGEKISVFEAWDERHEADFVTNQILDYQNRGLSLAEQVVFYRVHAQSRVLEDVLRRKKIPYKIIGGTRFYDRKEIKDMIAYLRILQNPSDDVSFQRIINTPARGVGKKAFDAIKSISAAERLSFYESIQRLLSTPSGLSAKVAKTLEDFLAFVKRIHGELEHLTVTEVLHRVLEKTKYVQELELERTVEAQARIQNIEEFFSAIEEFEELPPDPEFQGTRLARFLESISLSSDLDGWNAGTDVLTLMTFHTAKGLEFPIVFMMGLEEGIFPNGNAYSENLQDIEEERRLCYVGITRARKKLYLSYTRERLLYGNRQRNLPSRFLMEIPAELLESNALIRTPVEDDIPFVDFDDADEDQTPRGKKDYWAD